jgi:hypothetical protein
MFSIQTSRVDTQIGVMSQHDVDSYNEHVSSSEINFTDAQKDQFRSAGKFNDLNARLKLSDAKLANERELLRQLNMRLDLVAPIDGYFIAAVGRGSFVALGNPVGWIFSSKSQAPSNIDLTCAAPDDVTIADLKVLQGRVTRGQSLACLKSVNLSHYRTQLDAFASNIDVQTTAIHGRSYKEAAVEAG